MSPCAQSKSFHSLLSGKMGFWACGGFRQGRAPSLRAPEGSLDGFRRTQHNRRKREWELSEIREHFYRGEKGTFSSRRDTLVLFRVSSELQFSLRDSNRVALSVHASIIRAERQRRRWRRRPQLLW